MPQEYIKQMFPWLHELHIANVPACLRRFLSPACFCDAWLSCVVLRQSVRAPSPQLSCCARPIIFPAFCVYQDAIAYSSWNYWALGLCQL